MAKLYNLVCIAPDGDHVTEAREKSFEECERTSAELGSRWIFYPFHVITTRSNKTVVAAYDDIEVYIGKRLSTLKKAIAAGKFDYFFEE